MQHYVEMDEDREVHIISNCGIYEVYFVKGENYSLLYMFGLPMYQPSEDKYYEIDEVFHIAWNNFSMYEEMLDNE